LTNANNEVYEGEFVNGKVTGYGKYITSQNDVYEGYFVGDKPHGKGV